jgi:hypothetical protein
VPPKSVPDEESLAAGWFTLEEAERLPLREADVLEVLRYVRDGGPAYPISLLARKGDLSQHLPGVAKQVACRYSFARPP